MQEKLESQFTRYEVALQEKTEKDFMEKYDPAPLVDRTIDKPYFLKSYGYRLLIGTLFFLLFIDG